MKKQMKSKKLCGFLLGGTTVVLLSLAQQAQAECFLKTGPTGQGGASHRNMVISLVNIPQIYQGSTTAQTEHRSEFTVECDDTHSLSITPRASSIQSSLTNIRPRNTLVTYSITRPTGQRHVYVFDIVNHSVNPETPLSLQNVAAGTYSVIVTAPANRGVISESYMRDYNSGSRSTVLTLTPNNGSGQFIGELQAGMSDFKRDPCASRDSFTITYPNGRDVKVPLLTGRATGPVKTPRFGIQVNLIRESSKPDICAALVKPEIKFDDTVVQLRTTESGPRVDNGFELRLYRDDNNSLVGRNTIKMEEFNPSRGKYSSSQYFYGQVTRNFQKKVVEGPFRGTMTFTITYR